MTKSIERAKISKIFNALKTLPKEREYRILVRSVTFQPVGLITKREYLNDSSIGRSRDWAVGITFDGQIFREPLDMINPRTHELKTCIIEDNGFFIITARVSDDPGDDDKNFQWFASPDEMNTWHELNDQIKMKEGIISNQTENILNLTAEKELYYKESMRLGSHNKNLIVQTQKLSEQVSNLNTKNLLMESQVVNTAELRTELMAYLVELVKTAGQRGKLKAMSDEEIVDNALENMAHRERKIMSVPSSSAKSENGASNVAVLNRISKLDDRLKNVEANVQQTETPKLKGGIVKE